MRRLKISTAVLCSFAAMLMLMIGVAAVSISKTDAIGRVAQGLGDRVLIKTKIAGELVDLGQQLHFVDEFVLRTSSSRQDQLANRMIAAHVLAISAKTASYMHYIDGDLERRLLHNLERARTNYLDVQAQILAMPAVDRNMVDHETRLTETFGAMNQQARGLAHLAETQALKAREEASKLSSDGQTTVLSVSSLAFGIGVVILLILRSSIFMPLAHITRSLVGLAGGRLDVPVFLSGRGDEIDGLSQALEVFRRNAVALNEAHLEAKAAHRRADLLARHDALTGLPNRRLLKTTIEDTLARTARQGGACGVLVIDLDRFKPINDVLGHGAGDKVLREVAERLGSVIRAGETVARLGGDEFAVVMEFEPGSDAPLRLATRIIDAVSVPMVVEGRTVSVGTSVGIALAPTDGTEAEQLLHAADLAMFKAKRDEKGGFRLFQPSMALQLRARADCETRLRVAIAAGDVRPHYQPLCDLKRGTVKGFEILARWHDDGVIVPPCDFIPTANDAGLTPALTASLLRQACRDALRWPGDLTLALNVTPAQISDPSTPEAIFTILAEEGFPADRLELEITADALIGNVTVARTVMAAFRDRHVRLSLGSFGTGYSSLHHLRDLRFDTIKIDRSFVQSMIHNTESTKIVETVLGLGRSLGIDTVAEGIESGEHLATLLRFGCPYGQGYHLGRPLTAEAVGDMLRAPSMAAGAAAAQAA